jgi:hypothetical protein
MAGGIVALSCAARRIDRQDRNLANLLAQKELIRTKLHLRIVLLRSKCLLSVSLFL